MPTPLPTTRPDASVSRHLAVQRIVGGIGPDTSLETVVRDILAGAQSLFGAEVAGLWLLGEGEHPLQLAAHEGLGKELIDAFSRITRRDDLTGVRTVVERGAVVIEQPEYEPHFGEIFRRMGVRTVTFVPLVSGDESTGLLVLCHLAPFTWTDAELDLCATFASQMATATANARLFSLARAGAARLRAIGELSARLNRIQDVEGIGRAIVEGMDRLLRHDTIRVYRVDHVSETCEPIAFQGEFMGIGRPTTEMLRLPIGQGLTGWVALHNKPLRLGDAADDPRSVQIGERRGAESMLLVPMSWEDRVMGVIVVSTVGYDQYSDDDERTLEIFAGYAAQALANAEAFGEIRRQRAELHHRLESQRRLLEVNEKLLSTLDPSVVLEMIADSLKAVVAYDSLTIYRADWTMRTRRALVARDRFAEMILQHEAPVDSGLTGWVIRNGEAVLANEAHLDSRVMQIPGTPDEPEAMIVCPLQISGETVGTLNVSRMGGPEVSFSRDEFELVQLFAAQASIALRNAEAHGEMITRAEHDALTGLRNHGAFQRELGEAVGTGMPFALLMIDLDAFKGYNDTHGHPAGDALLARIAAAMRETLRDDDRVYRYGGDEFAIILPRAGIVAAREIADRVRTAVAHLTEGVGPLVTASVGIAMHPDDGLTKDEVVASADRALYLAKPPSRTRGTADDPTRDPYLAAVDQTTLRLMERLEPAELLRDIVERAAALVGVKHGFLYLLEDAPGADVDLVCRVGTGIFEELIGYRLPKGTGIGWTVISSGRAAVVDDYAEYAHRARDLDGAAFGAVCAVPLTSGDEVVGLIGLASGDTGRPFSEREMEALARFAQLASVALDNGRLFERAQTEVRQRAHAALHDTLTGLPNRTLLLNRMAEQLQPDGRTTAVSRSSGSRVALVLLDLDRFKVVNETLGHAAGDLLLVGVAQRLVAAARTTDTVARLGSDEFGVLLGAVRSVREAERVAARIQRELALPFDLDGQDVEIGASAGLAIGRTLTTYPNDLLREAEIALHRAKADGAGGTVLFDPEMRAQTVERASLEHDLRRAIERHELRLHYQPLVDLSTGAIVGVEALLRWQHPSRGLIPPLAFIPLAEETGLILPIGRWVLESSCAQLRDWQRRIPAARDLALSVNISARQFAQADLVGTVAQILDHTGIDPANLELEITESVVMDQSEASVERLHGLRALGVRLVLDDFGTGYSSLAYLRRLPLDTIKVDRSFVSGLGEEPVDRPIVQTVIALAHGLGIDVVAEGIETLAQRDELRSLDCDRGQGYWFARPLPVDELERVLVAARGPVVLPA
ncbi:MAG: EAL domain-containing protein [Chloroflexota bacterium]